MKRLWLMMNPTLMKLLPMLIARFYLLLLLLCNPLVAHAHVGSKDVFQTVNAGPYQFYVTIRPPNVIPGIATVEVRSSGAPVTSLQIAPLPVTGEAAKHPPASDPMQASAADPAFYTGAIWIMAPGTWQVRIQAEGSAGSQMASVPVLAVPIATLRMQPGLGAGLALLGLVLMIGMAGIVGASFRESGLRPGVTPTSILHRRGLVATAISLAVMICLVVASDHWWNVEAADYTGNLYAPSPVRATLTGNQLDLHITLIKPRRKPLPGMAVADSYLPDHGHLMHLYAIRQPQLDAAFHLHPEQVGIEDFRATLPTMPAGTYKLYGDVVHRSGLPETLLATVTIPPNMPGSPLASEDASATPAPLERGLLGTGYELPNGYTMQWDRPATLEAGTAYTFHFHLLDPQGKPARDMQPYLGMAGHAAFVKTDGTVFAHTHPEGSAAMADLMLASESTGGAPMAMDAPASVTPDVNFPYGFPTTGRYRIFIQMKHENTVETGVFDAEVK